MNYRKLKITRMKQIMLGTSTPYSVIIDGKDRGTIQNNHSSETKMDFQEHNIQFFADFPDGAVYSEIFYIPANNQNYHINTYTKMGMFRGKIIIEGNTY